MRKPLTINGLLGAIVVAAIAIAVFKPFQWQKDRDAREHEKALQTKLNAELNNQITPTGMAKIIQLVKEGAPVDGDLSAGQTPLLAAIRLQDPEAMKALISLGAAVGAPAYPRSKTPLIAVCSYHYFTNVDEKLADIAAPLLESGRLDFKAEGAILVFEALRQGHFSLARTLIKSGADIHGRDVQSTTIAGALVRQPMHWEGDARLQSIWRRDLVTMFEILLEGGMKLDAESGNSTPLIYAMLQDHNASERQAHLLLQSIKSNLPIEGAWGGVDVRKVLWLDKIDQRGFRTTLLHLIASYLRPFAVTNSEAELESTIDEPRMRLILNAPDQENRTPLDRAVEGENDVMIRLLISRGGKLASGGLPAGFDPKTGVRLNKAPPMTIPDLSVEGNLPPPQRIPQ